MSEMAACRRDWRERYGEIYLYRLAAQHRGAAPYQAAGSQLSLMREVIKLDANGVSWRPMTGNDINERLSKE